MVSLYLPDIIEDCTTRANTFLSTRVVDPFNIFYEKGLIGQVKRSVFSSPEKMPLVWLVMKFDESFTVPLGVHSEVSFQIIVSIDTDKDYTQTQRETLKIKPRLFPICDRLLYEMRMDKRFATIGENSIRHTRHVMPYWGHGDVEGQDVNNLFKDKFIDSVAITVQGLRIRRINQKC